MHIPAITKSFALASAALAITAFGATKVFAVPPTTSKPAASATNSKSVSAGKAAAASKAADTNKTPSKSSPKAAESAALPNLSGTWNIKFREAPLTKTHIMAVKVAQKNGVLTATGVDEYGDVILNGTFTAPNKIAFKRTYKGTQVNPTAQYEGTYTPGTTLTPISAKGKWSAQPFADKSQKPKASANSGDWDANIFTGPAINK
ncbi:MAG: hypothetical protein JST89_21030 [Cyanobacteria bacterium SZAS-4]|nr:hypothetical protein [Cyanobacteria bacterium SZAS-4]